jgi:multisubunit Na+/H+ antiporter MnhG subunit
MSASGIIALVLVALGIAVGLLSALAMLPLTFAFDRLHFVAPAAVGGMWLIAVGIVAEEGLSATGVKSLLVAAILTLVSPILTHATARSGWRGPHRKREEER